MNQLKASSGSRTSGAFVAGLLLAIGAVIVAGVLTSGPESPAESTASGGIRRPDIDLQKDGPLPEGQRVSLGVADAAIGGLLPVPPTTDSTGQLTAVWEDGGQVAFVWRSDLRFYAQESELSEGEVLAEWEVKLNDPEEPYWTLVEVRGKQALGVEGTGPDQPSSLTFMEQGIAMQFVAPNHTLGELLDFAESMKFR